ncbi:bifunctional 3'-5' exonuclease/DNA polymerase [Oerskovia turbata]|uniref:DNA-directed DNA polymerase n=1 Tax=Oerskovia turbata TaxID=1713 RepID=A0A4Q1L1F2_9CELL|nr:bifunctional 3'-5' exonuclease/DNA polymerase [Oerskovia turbata]RXR36597.1 bifunctional 3'-5' exonuclease/DNA polymerase [Oerskovia turbata]
MSDPHGRLRGVYSVPLRTSSADPGVVDVEDLDPQGGRLHPAPRRTTWPGAVREQTVPPTPSPAVAATTTGAPQAETPTTRWVWDDTNLWYPAALAAGLRVERAHDLRLTRAILRRSVLTTGTPLTQGPRDAWDDMHPVPTAPVPGVERPDALFDLGDRRAVTPPDPVGELRRQLEAVATSSGPGRLRLLIAAESAGALVAAEMSHAGLPWREDLHDAMLTGILGARPPLGLRPARLEALAERVRAALDAPALNPDSAPELLKALEYAGVGVKSTRKWDLERVDHPVVAPLLEYKKLSRLLTANGWNWLDTWVRDGRFRPEYVVGGVVTGRWAANGGGALQLPHQVRSAVVADPGWKLVVADAAQLEPRVLAGLAGDLVMAEAGRGGDMYQGIVDTGAVETRAQAKIGMLGAMYGGTTGESGRMLPRLAKAFPRALDLVEQAARAGERGEIVTTRLGRSSPPPGSGWDETQGSAYDESASSDAQSRARSQTRAWGRFTRNFVVQGTAAEWALCWMASLRGRLAAMPRAATPGLAPAPFTEQPHMVFFLHDEIIVHTPAELAEQVADEIRAAGAEAGKLLFGDFPVDFPLTVAIVDDYSQAK